MMKILLTNPATREPLKSDRERYFIKAGSRWPWTYVKNKKIKNTCCFFPFFLAYTASILRDHGHDVHVIDGVALDLQTSDFLRQVKQLEPDLIIIETTTHAINHDLMLCKAIKGSLSNTLILLSGAHATVFAKQILQSSECIDFVALGEYEYVVLELVRRLQVKNQNLRIKGLSYRINEKIWVSNEKGFIKDINTLPYPAFDIFPSNEAPNLTIYGDGIHTYWPTVTLHSSRGCPFKCDFCMWNQIMYSNGPYRMFNPQRVVDEMEYVVEKYGAKEIYFDDDDFCVNKRHVMDICFEIKRRNLDIKWSCMGDAMCTDEEMVKAMADAKCIFMKFGVESGNRSILKNIGKPLDPEKAIKIAKWCRKYGIMTHATFAFGLDGDTEETMRDTLKLANRIKFDTAQASIVTPFPGTEYYKKLKHKKFLKDIEWNMFDGTTVCTFTTDKLNPNQIEQFRKKAIRSMVFHKIIDPIWVARFLKREFLVARNYGMKAAFEPIKALINL